MVDELSRSSVGTVRQVVTHFEEKFENRKSYIPEGPLETKPNITSVATTAEVNYALPSPTDTPYRTPSSSRSRQTSRTYEDMSPETTPPPLPYEISGRRGSHESLNTAQRENLPLSDPRRFTPTLHASLVSEILSLRRDAETRIRDIERLEQSFHEAQTQNQNLNNSILVATRETRQAKRQMQILEGGTLSAINDLAKERDDAIKDAAEIRTRMEQAQKKSKNQEDSMERVHEQWQRDKEAWNTEKRALETKIHISEGRLRIVLSEVANAQLVHSSEDPHSPRRSQSRTSVLGSPRNRADSAAARRLSGGSILSEHLAGGRTSVLSFAHADAVNLADELALEDIDEDYTSQPDQDGHLSPERVVGQTVRPSSSISLKARKVLGLPIDLSEFEQVERVKPADALSILSEPRSSVQENSKVDAYVEQGTQYSRPASPVISSNDRMLETPVQRFHESAETSRAAKTLSVVSHTSQDSAQYSVDTSDNAWEENLHNQPIMVSSACQTVEQLPETPLTARIDSSLPTIREAVETREMSVQTDSSLPIHAPIPVATHRRTDTELTTASMELQIPTIAIIPPASRPVTPDELAVKLPPRTKNAGCQVESHILCDYTSTGIQTEDIRIDKRSMIPSVPSVPLPPIPTNLPPTSFGKAKGQSFSRKMNSNAPNSSMRRAGPAQSLPPINDDGPLSETKQEIGRPVRSSSMFAGFDDGDEPADFDDDVFHDDEFFNRPMTKLVLSRGKILAATKDLDDIEETEAAVAAGKRFALEQIRRSEEYDRDFEIGNDLQIKPTLKATKQVKRVASSQAANMRRTALISSGTAAHQTKSSLSSIGSGDVTRPPVPIPVRYSSARVGKSISDGGRSSRGSSQGSPTRYPRRISKSLRKTRSGPAISPAGQARRPRSKSPPLDERVSIVPDMPNFKMPKEQKETPKLTSSYSTTFGATAQLPSVEHLAMGNSMHEHPDVFANQSTTVVDAIAQTMVGEWMYKYVRRRKSFGKPDKEWDPSKSVEEMSSGTSTGVRHKRWVWLAPYERSVMWSSKQPTDGTSLLGKSGRKLTIKSVLDVKDDNPMPKGSIIGPHFNRSILILTSQRALKFTATTQDRHYIWLTALSFLSHSPISMNDLAPLPPLPSEDPIDVTASPTASLGGSLRRRPIRDSIRIAKGSSARPQFRSFTTDGIPTMSEYERPQTREHYDPLNDAAMPPVIRRYHNRNRSNTAPKPTTVSAFRALLSRDSGPPTNAPSTAVTDRATLDRGPLTPTSLGVPSRPSSRRGSEASAIGRLPLAPPIQTIDMPLRLFDTASNSSHAASMTMRMDAFMADQHRQAMMRGIPPRGPARNLRLGRPSMRNLKDATTSSWINQDHFRDSMSPVDSTLQTPTDLRFSADTGRGSSEVGGYYK